MAMVGFLPGRTTRASSATVKAIEVHLLEDGFVKRYDETGNVDGLAGGHEGAFLPCSFWLADNYVLMGRHDEARALFERLIGLCNDVGLLSEEYDSRAGRQVGNFPQAFTHVALDQHGPQPQPGVRPRPTSGREFKETGAADGLSEARAVPPGLTTATARPA